MNAISGAEEEEEDPLRRSLEGCVIAMQQY
jgi:hypothetical protein